MHYTLLPPGLRGVRGWKRDARMTVFYGSGHLSRISLAQSPAYLRHEHIHPFARPCRPGHAGRIIRGDTVEHLDWLITDDGWKPPVAASRHVDLDPDALRFLKVK